MNTTLLAAAGALLLAAFAGPLSPASAGTGVKRDVLYGPTPYKVVDRMLEMAGIGRDDYLIDLGSGDGRIVIEAAKKYGTRGKGIDIDPKWIETSTAKARKEGVAGKTEFAREDLFKTDLSGATVVTMFLNPQTNLRVRSKLLNELRPGTRVVSHKYDMPDWSPDREETVGERHIFMWVVPANASGTWTWKARGGAKRELKLQQRFQKVSGTLATGGFAVPVKDAVIEGDTLRFSIAGRGRDGKEDDETYEARIDGDRMSGTVKGTAALAGGDGRRWEAVRTPGTGTLVSGDDILR